MPASPAVAQTLWRAALDQAEVRLRAYKDEATAQIEVAEAARNTALLAQAESEKRVQTVEVRVAEMEQIRLDLERALADERGRRESIDKQVQDLQRQLEGAQSERKREREEAEKRIALELQRTEMTEQRLMGQLDEYKVTLKRLDQRVAEERQAWQGRERELQELLRGALERASEQTVRADGLAEKLSGALTESETLHGQMKELLQVQGATELKAGLLERERNEYREALRARAVLTSPDCKRSTILSMTRTLQIDNPTHA